jgi:hypothetical protein
MCGRYEQLELAFLGSHLGNVDMEVADRIGLELRRRHLATVFGLMPSRPASALKLA